MLFIFSFILLLTNWTPLVSSKAFLEIISDNKDHPDLPSSQNISSSPITSNTSSHDDSYKINYNIDDDLTDNTELNSIISLFSHNYFYGHWQSTNDSVIKDFSNRDGYTYLHYDTLSTFPLDMHLYDGDYIDSKVMTLLYHDLRQGAVYDKTTQTLTVINAATNQQMGKMYGNFEQPTMCPMNITARFLNIYTSQPYQLTDDSDQLGIQFDIESNVCIINLATSIMTKTDQLFQSQALPYSIIGALLALSQCLILHYFHQLVDKQHHIARRTSAWSIVILNGFDLYLFLSVSYFFMSYSPVFELGSIPSALLAFCFEPKIIWKIIQHQRGVANEASRPAIEVKTYFCMLSLFLLVLASLVVFPDFSYFLGSIYLIPQIKHNFTTSQRYRWNFWIIIGLGVPKLLFLIYTKVDPNNIFRISPNLYVVFLCSGLMALQLIILGIQTRWPRFGFEKKPVYLVSSYRASLSRQDVCAICLDKLKDSFGSSSPGPSFIGTDATLRDRRKILTPCKHEFHLFCLRQWLESKLECPYCRKHLPILPEEYLDE